MTLWNSIAELNRLQNEFNSLFNTIDQPLTGRRVWNTPHVRRYPLINLYEDDNEYRIEALAPGFDPEKFDVSLIEHYITIKGEHPQQEQNKPVNYLRNERFVGKFTRTFELPGEVDADNVTAEYKYGVLTVHVAKAEKQKPRSIKINVE